MESEKLMFLFSEVIQFLWKEIFMYLVWILLLSFSFTCHVTHSYFKIVIASGTIEILMRDNCSPSFLCIHVFQFYSLRLHSPKLFGSSWIASEDSLDCSVEIIQSILLNRDCHWSIFGHVALTKIKCIPIVID